MAFASLVLAVLSVLPGFKRAGTDELFPIAAKVAWEVRDGRFAFVAETEMPPEGLLKRVDKRANGVSRFVSIDDCYVFGFPKRFAVNARGATSVALEGLETSSVETNGMWKFSLSVPLASVGGFPENGELKVVRNFARVDPIAGARASVTLRTGRKDDPVISGCAFGKGTNGSYPIAIDVTNPDTRSRSLTLSFVGSPVNSQPCEILKDFSLGAGQTRSFTARGPVLDDEKVDWRLSLSEGKRKIFEDRGVFSPNFKGPVFMRPAGLAERISFRLAYFPSYDRLRVRIDAAQLPSRAGAKLSVLASATDEVIAEWEPKFDERGVADETRAIPDLRPVTVKNGNPDYVLVFRTTDGVELKRLFKRFAMEWEGNRFGLSDTVPAPFEKVKREKVGGESRSTGELEKVSVVLREHIVDKKTGLWKQVTAAGKELLARPMRLVEGEDRTSGTSKTSRTLSCASCLSCLSCWDVDGLCDWRLTLLPGHHEPLSLEIPLKASEARLMHSCVDGLRANYGGAVPSGTGRVWDGSKCKGRIGIIGDYVNYLWVGGALRGVAVFGDNDKGWVLENQVEVKGGGGERKDSNSALQLQLSTSTPLPCQEIIREADGTVVIRLNLVQRPVDLAEPRTIRLGFQATPVKPMPEHWRSRSIGRLVGATKYWGGLEGVSTSDETDLFLRKYAEARKTGKVDRAFLADYLEHHVPFKGVPGSADYKRDRENLRIHQETGMYWAAMSAKKPDEKHVFYTNARGVEYGNESGLTYMDEWSRIEWKDRDVGRRELREYELDPVASYRDYAAFWYRKIFGTGAANALYWDDVYAAPNWDLVGTDAYRLPDGRIQPSGGIFNMRALIRRCAVVQAELGRETRDNWVHMTNTELAPVCAFAGVNYDWEDIYGNTPFQERYPREMIIACSLGRQMGNRVSVMGYFAEKDADSPLLKKLERGGTGVCLVHEFDWSRVAVWREANKRLEDWGYRKDDTRVWNYWDEDVAYPVQVSGGESASLAMSREGRALVIVSDWKDGGDFRVKPDCAALGVRADFTATDLETGKPLPVADGAVRVKVARHDFAMVEMK